MTLRGGVFALLGLAIVALAVELARESPSPGPLAAAHAALPELAGLAGCEACHAAGGLEPGCTRCHEAIAAQLASATGWHGTRAARGERACERCHGEHWGADYPLVNALSWGGEPTFAGAHDHVAFELAGAHAPLTCDRCHRPEEARRSFLGLSQACVACHADPHGAAMSDECARCHGQDAFAPAARFEHSSRFPLLGAHERAACADCHPGATQDAAVLDFATVRGTRCEECHESPHRAPLPGRCDACHKNGDDGFAAAAPRLTAAAHAATGFELIAPHQELACAACHGGARAAADVAPFAQRFPGGRTERCTACHASPHGGQFGPREERCAECHSTSFAPSRVTAASHRPPLEGAHVAAACARCHRAEAAGAPVAFVGTPSACAACHADPHGGQFAARGEACDACHGQQRFVPSRYDFAARHPPLQGAHAAVACAGCHRASAPSAPVRWRATPTRCEACHADPHGGQFAKVRDGCAACHDERRFVPSLLTAARHQPPLAGAHLAVACSQCHPKAAGAPQRFRATPRDCKSCHADPHAGQLTRAGNDCNRCHRSEERWLPVEFDHQRDSRFALDGVHARVACARCHPRTPLADGREVIHYAPLGVECRDCHTGK